MICSYFKNNCVFSIRMNRASLLYPININS